MLQDERPSECSRGLGYSDLARGESKFLARGEVRLGYLASRSTESAAGSIYDSFPAAFRMILALWE